MNCSTKAVTAVFMALSAAIVVGFCTAISNIPCHEGERQALLRFKHDLTDASNRLASWADDDKNCCEWSGIVCHNLTGHVLEIHLRNPYAGYRNWTGYQAYQKSKLGGKLNDSLMYLKHLHYLDLSDNDFGGTRIPKFFGSMGSLRHLNLSAAGFAGIIPHQLGNLSSLQNLSLGYQNIYTLYVENLQWLSGLSYLQHLDMSSVDLSKASDWLQVTNALPALKELHFSKCQLYLVPLFSRINFSSLVTLDLSDNQFNVSSIPTWVFSLRSLVSLDLSSNNFQGSIPVGLRNITSLKYLSLSHNYFNSSLPSWSFDFPHLETLIVSNNNLQGKISDAIGNLISAIHLDLSYNGLEGELPKYLENLCNLKMMDLSGIKLDHEISQILELLGCASDVLETLSFHSCQLSGHLTSKLGEFKNLKYLDLSTNRISGLIPDCLGLLSSLKELHLSENQLNGTLPESLGQLKNLEFFYVDHNSLGGNVSEVFFADLTRLNTFYASQNSLSLTVSPDWIPSFQLERICLSSWHLGPEFPVWLRSQKYLWILDISNTGIIDTIPRWFWSLSSQFSYLNLSHNHCYGEVPPLNVSDLGEVDLSSNYFEGPLPSLYSNLIVLDLSNNSFSGSISHFLCYTKDEPKMLEFLRLGNNKLSAEIPDCWISWQSLISVELQNNQLTGNLPSSIGYLSSLQSLHLRNNHLSGFLPSSLQNCTQLLALDLGENNFLGRIPRWIGERLSCSMIISLRSNNFWGHIPHELCALRSLKILDLAHNYLSGKIPHCFKNFSAMTENYNSGLHIWYHRRIIAEFSEFYLENAMLVVKGLMREYSKNLYLVTIMDLSNNSLSGKIPVEITGLLGLQSLNLSRNRLTGKIPESIGNMGSLESLDLSLNQLCCEIPSSMSKMTFLSVLNLSYNNLTGKIPTSTQLQTFDASSFLGNHLYGLPVSGNHSTDDATATDESKGRKHTHAVDWFYVSLPLGFVVGFWAMVGPLLFRRSWRFAYFQWLDRIWDKLTWHLYYCRY